MRDPQTKVPFWCINVLHIPENIPRTWCKTDTRFHQSCWQHVFKKPTLPRSSKVLQSFCVLLHNRSHGGNIRGQVSVEFYYFLKNGFFLSFLKLTAPNSSSFLRISCITGFNFRAVSFRRNIVNIVVFRWQWPVSFQTGVWKWTAIAAGKHGLTTLLFWWKTLANNSQSLRKKHAMFPPGFRSVCTRNGTNYLVLWMMNRSVSCKNNINFNVKNRNFYHLRMPALLKSSR